MRDLKVCQAEVFRRSENRIKARKKRRNRILMTCIPMVLGVTVITAALWPKDGGSPAFVGMQESATCAQAEETLAGVDVNFGARVEVTGEDISLYYAQTADVLKITDFLNSLTLEQPENAPEDIMDVPLEPEAPGDNRAPSAGGGESTDESGNKHSLSPGIFDNYSTIQADGLTIAVTAEDGTQTQYSLNGNILTDLTNNQAYPLTPQQVQELKILLGVSGS